MSVRTGLEIAIICIVLIMAGVIVYDKHNQKVSATTPVWTEAQKIKEVEKVKTITVPGPTQIVTIEKPVIVERLKLGDSIAKDPDKQITATAEVESYEGETHVVSVIDTKTGESKIEAKQEPLPLFGFPNQKEIGARGGVSLNGYAGEVYARYTFLRINKFHIAAYGSFGSSQTLQPEGKTMIDISYRW